MFCHVVGVLISTAQNPTSFQNFTTAVNFTSESGEGPFCMPIDLSASVSGLSSGQNATIQLVFDGGDGQLYQVRFYDTSYIQFTNLTFSARILF